MTTKSKNTKKALLASVISLTLCMAMLIGTTFAWFTDTASTGVNEIKAGTLDIAIEKNIGIDQWKNVEGETLNFIKDTGEAINEAILWEPNCTYELPELRIKNNGNLALKFKLLANGITGDGKKLAEVLDVIIKDDTGAWQTVGTLEQLIADPDGIAHGILLPKDSSAEQLSKIQAQVVQKGGKAAEVSAETTAGYKIALHMQSTADNTYQGLSLNDISFTVLATQYTVEYDSFNNTYDEKADYPEVSVPTTDKEFDDTLKDQNSENITIDLTRDMTLNTSDAYLKLGGDNTKTITINGNGHNITLETTYWSRLNLKNSNATLVIKDATITSSQTSGTWNSYDVTFLCNTVLDNVKFKKAVALDAAGKTITMKNVIIEEMNDYYSLWITSGTNVTIQGGEIKSTGTNIGRAIKISDEYVNVPTATTLSITGTKFVSNKKATILIGSKGDVNISLDNIDISGVTADKTNAVWIDEAYNTTTGKVTVKGGTVVNEP